MARAVGEVVGEAGADWRVGVLTVSDRVAAGSMSDGGGPALASWVRAMLHVEPEAAVSPDGIEPVQAALSLWVRQGLDLVLTTGGTGYAPRDLTPEATCGLIQRPAPQLLDLARARCLPDKPHAYLSRGVAGVAEQTLLINLPGSPRGAVDTLEKIADVLLHALHQLRGTADPSPPRGTHPR